MRAKHALSDSYLGNNSMLQSVDDHGESSSLKQRIVSQCVQTFLEKLFCVLPAAIRSPCQVGKTLVTMNLLMNLQNN